MLEQTACCPTLNPVAVQVSLTLRTDLLEKDQLMSRLGAAAFYATLVLMVLCGLALAGGGVWLILVGGSWFYVVAGIAFLASAVLLAMRRSEALLLYGAFVLATLAWALWEAGFDWWPLAARGDVIFEVGS